MPFVHELPKFDKRIIVESNLVVLIFCTLRPFLLCISTDFVFVAIKYVNAKQVKTRTKNGEKIRIPISKTNHDSYD